MVNVNIEEFKEMWRLDFSREDIANYFDIHRDYVRRLARKFNLPKKFFRKKFE